MSISVVTVLHDSAGQVGGMIESLASLRDAELQVICVDSGSSDGGGEIASRLGAEVIGMEGNPGYGAACNAGVAAATGEVCVLLNPDTRLVDRGLLALARVAASERVILAPRLLNSDGTVQRSAHPVPGRLDSVLAAAVPPRLIPGPIGRRLEPFRAPRPMEVGWAIGACLVASTGLLREFGPFDPSVFLYGEDMDLCLRARAAGVPVVYRPDVSVIHEGGRSTERALAQPERLEMQARRRREVILEQLGPGALAVDDAAQRLTFRLRSASGRERPRNRALLEALDRAQKSPS